MQVRLAYDIFMCSGVVDELGIPEAELSGFLSAVSSHYHCPADVPYHNLAHVVQVLHAVWLVRLLCRLDGVATFDWHSPTPFHIHRLVLAHTHTPTWS